MPIKYLFSNYFVFVVSILFDFNYKFFGYVFKICKKVQNIIYILSIFEFFIIALQNTWNSFIASFEFETYFFKLSNFELKISNIFNPIVLLINIICFLYLCSMLFVFFYSSFFFILKCIEKKRQTNTQLELSKLKQYYIENGIPNNLSIVAKSK